MSTAEVLRRITTALDRAGIAYMLTGSFAGSYYGTPRTTQDVDLVIDPTHAQLRTLFHLLPSEEYYFDLDAALEAHNRHSLFNVVDMVTGWKIDLVIRKDRAFSEEEFRRRTPVYLQGMMVLVASAEDVVVSKLEWARAAQSTRQIEDVAAILRVRREALDRAYLEKWIAELGLNTEWAAAQCAAGVSD